MSIPQDLKYTKSHEWVMLEEDGTATIGITQHAQELLGDMVFVETPSVGRTLEQGEECAVVESVKAASDVYAPVSGEVIEGNQALADDPSLVNSDPEGEGWFFKIRLSDNHQLSDLMNAEQYKAFCDSL